MSRAPSSSEASKYPPTEFSLKYTKVLAPNGKLIPPDQVFGEGGLFDKDVEEKTKLAFKVTMKKLEKYNTASEFNKEHLKLLPNTIQKTKWSKKSKEVENWDIWWSMHEKILQPLRAQAEVIHKWWDFTGKPDPGVE